MCGAKVELVVMIETADFSSSRVCYLMKYKRDTAVFCSSDTFIELLFSSLILVSLKKLFGIDF